MQVSNAVAMVVVALGCAISACTPQPAPQPQPEHPVPPEASTEMPHHTLLLARLDAAQVDDKSTSRATGTGVFLVDPVQHTLQYRLTYEGLQAGGAKRIALYNYGAGKDGALVAQVCGEASPCPQGRSATITGRIVPGAKQPVDNALTAEIFSERVYVEIIGGEGEREIRGQLLPHSAMVPFANFLADMQPRERKTSKATGTAVGSETYLPEGKISVMFAATVAGLSGPPTGMALAAGPSPKDKRISLPQLRIEKQRSEDGATFLAIYEVDADTTDAPLISRFRREGYRQTGLVVMTQKFPEGEVYGVLEPIR